MQMLGEQNFFKTAERFVGALLKLLSWNFIQSSGRCGGVSHSRLVLL